MRLRRTAGVFPIVSRILAWMLMNERLNDGGGRPNDPLTGFLD